MNIALVLVHLIIGIALTSYFGSKRPDDYNFDDWLAASGSLRDLLVGLICLVIGLAFIAICLIGCLAVCCRCCCLLVILVPLTLVVAIVCFAIGSLAENLSRFIDDICTETEDEIKVLYSDSVDVPMCSDMCPCKESDFNLGNYNTMSDSDLVDFRRSALWADVAGSYSGKLPDAINVYTGNEMPLFTDAALTEFLTLSGNSVSDLTESIEAAGNTVPTSVSTYKECFDAMIDTSGGEFQSAQSSDPFAGSSDDEWE